MQVFFRYMVIGLYVTRWHQGPRSSSNVPCAELSIGILGGRGNRRYLHLLVLL